MISRIYRRFFTCVYDIYPLMGGYSIIPICDSIDVSQSRPTCFPLFLAFGDFVFATLVMVMSVANKINGGERLHVALCCQTAGVVLSAQANNFKIR